MKNKGYTIPELVVVIVVVGVVSLIAINRVSYAFQDTDTIVEKTEEQILIKSATAYAKSIKDQLKNNGDVYIIGKDLVDAEYLIDDDNIYTNTKVRLSYVETDDNVFVEILK